MIIHLPNPLLFKQNALLWASSFDVCCCLDSNNFQDPYSKFDCLLAVGVKDEIVANSGNAFEELKTFRENNPGYVTGFFSYDLKNELENLSSNNIDNLHFPDLYFFSPLHLILIKGTEIEITSDESKEVLKKINEQQPIPLQKQPAITLRSRFTRREYIDTAKKIKQHISRGDIYVTNFCQEFFSEGIDINPVTLFSSLNSLSPNPFGSFFKWHNKTILSASPERYLAKRDNKLISQPIKGTAKRGSTIDEDEQIKKKPAQ